MGPNPPPEWIKERVGSLFTLQLGKMLNKKAREASPRFPYLGNRDVQWGRFDFSELREMHFDEREREKFRLFPGDLLVCEGGEVGRAALWTGEFDCYYQKAIHRLRARDGRVEPEFMLHFMRFAATNGLLSDLTSQSSIAHLTREKLALLELCLPPLPEQRKIAAILSSVDEVIGKTEAVIEQLQVVKKAMMQELLTRGLPGRHTRFKQTEIGEIPEAWEVVELGEVLEGIDAGWSPKCDSAPAGPTDWGVLKVSSVTWGRFDPTENKRLPGDLEPRPNIEVRTGDVILSRANTPSLVGRAVVVDETRSQLMLSDKLLRLRVSSRSLPDFVNLVLATPDVRQRIQDGATGSSKSMKNLSQGKLRALPVPLPSIREQQATVEAVSTIDARVDSEMNALGGARALKTALMSVLLTGEVRVTPDEEAA